MRSQGQKHETGSVNSIAGWCVCAMEGASGVEQEEEKARICILDRGKTWRIWHWIDSKGKGFTTRGKGSARRSDRVAKRIVRYKDTF